MQLSLHHYPQFNPVIRCVNQVLLRTEVTLCRLNGCVPEEQLDLLQFATRGPAELRARATLMPYAA
jgi:hypothetical protein